MAGKEFLVRSVQCSFHMKCAEYVRVETPSTRSNTWQNARDCRKHWCVAIRVMGTLSVYVPLYSRDLCKGVSNNTLQTHNIILSTAVHSEDTCFDKVETGEQHCHLDLINFSVWAAEKVGSMAFEGIR